MPHWMVKMYGESVRVYDPVLLIEIMKNVAICTALQFIFVAFVFFVHLYLLQKSFVAR